MQTSYTIERLKSIVRLGSIHFIATSFLLPFFSQQNTMTWIYPPSNNGKWRLFRLRFPNSSKYNIILVVWDYCILRFRPPKKKWQNFSHFEISSRLPHLCREVCWVERCFSIFGSFGLEKLLAFLGWWPMSCLGPLMLQNPVLLGYVWIHDPCGDLLCLGWWFI